MEKIRVYRVQNVWYFFLISKTNEPSLPPSLPFESFHHQHQTDLRKWKDGTVKESMSGWMEKVLTQRVIPDLKQEIDQLEFQRHVNYWFVCISLSLCLCLEKNVMTKGEKERVIGERERKPSLLIIKGAPLRRWDFCSLSVVTSLRRRKNFYHRMWDSKE